MLSLQAFQPVCQDCEQVITAVQKRLFYSTELRYRDNLKPKQYALSPSQNIIKTWSNPLTRCSQAALSHPSSIVLLDRAAKSSAVMYAVLGGIIADF